MTLVGPVILLVVLISAQPIHGALSKLLAPADMVDDLEFLETTIRQVHPEPFHAVGVDTFVRSFVQARRSVEEPKPIEAFYYLTLSLAALLEDSHTTLLFEHESNELPLRFWWSQDGLVVAGATARIDVEPGWLVRELGGQTPEEILSKADAVFPTENEHNLKNRTARQLHSGSFLHQIGAVVDGHVELTFCRNDECLVTAVPLSVPVTVNSLVPLRPAWGWRIVDEEDIGVFFLDSADQKEGYSAELQRFFRAVVEHGIEHVVLDLRWNVGGTVDVIPEFLRFFPEQRIEGYAGEIRYSQQAAQQRGYEETTGVERVSHLTRLFGGYTMNLPPRPLDTPSYEGQLYLLTSPMTAGTAHWFAVVIQDNDLGIVAGEPTGQRPTGYGDSLEFTLPNSGLLLTVAHKRYVRPHPNRDPSDSLYPDWELPITAADVATDSDLQMERLLDQIRINAGQ